ncbi:MAG: TolC family protein, partial [Bacteroidota bacterium]
AGTEGLAFPTDPMQPMAASFPEAPGTFWTLGLNVTLPLFEGGGRTARLARATAEVHRLQLERDLIAQRIEQNVRTQLHVTAASYAAIQEARRAADAARQSLDIVTRSYAAGALDVTALLESQAAAQRAEAGVTNAVYDFLVNVKRVERAIGRFEALAPAEEQEAFRRRLDAALQSTSSTP